MKALKEDTPEGMLFGRKAKVSHLKVFGCIAYAQVLKKLQKKLEPNGEKLIMIGYSKHIKGYHLWNLLNDKIIMSRDVVFDEGKVGIDMKPSHEPLFESDKVSSSIRDDDDIEYEVDYILDECEHDGIKEYLVKWTDYDESESTWEPYDNLADMKALEDWESRTGTITTSNIVQGSLEMDMDYAPNEDEDPVKVSDALSRNDANEWKLAMQDEYRSLQDNKTWDVVPRPKDHNVIDTKWLFKIKRNPDGSINKCKVRYLM